MTKEAIAKAPSQRVRRTPVGRRNVLTVDGKDPNYVYRVVNDRGNRINQFKAAGYEICAADEVEVGDSRVGIATPTSSLAEVEVGGGQKSYVMRIRKDWYDEDQTAKQAQVKQMEAATREKALDGNYGKIDITR